MTETASGAPLPTEVVTCFLRNRGDVLLVRRSAKVGSYRGRWGGVSGHVETDDPLEDAWREIQEETGLQDHVELVKRGEPFWFTDEGAGRSWRVHPFLFDSSSREAKLDWEAVEGAWVAPTAILERDCVPRLWTSYARVAPTLDDVRADRQHGSTYLSLRALEVLRDHAAALAAGVEVPGFEAVAAPALDVAGAGAGPVRVSTPAAGEVDGFWSLARELCQAQPAMTAVYNRVASAMDLAGETCERAAERTPKHGEHDASPGLPALSATADGSVWALAVASAAQATLEQSLVAEDTVVSAAAELVAGRRVLTLSLSGTVSRALFAAAPVPGLVVVMESRPGGEGRTLATRLAAHGIDAALVPDAAVAWALAEFRVELVLVGADTVLPAGDVVNKVGTRPAALAARDACVPFLVAATRDKIAAEAWSWNAASEGGATGSELEGASSSGADREQRREHARELEPKDRTSVRWRSPLFERTPTALITGVVTEAGVLDASGVWRAKPSHRQLHRRGQ